MSRYEIRIAGLGGQGVIMAGVMIGRAAAVFGGKQASQTQSYGPESRGGACKTEVVISDGDIDFPKVRKPDLLALMSQEAYEKYISDVKPDTVIIIDPDMIVEREPEKHWKVHRVPVVRIAEQLGKKIVANMALVGAIAGTSGIVDKESLEKTIAKYTPKAFTQLNIEAFRQGYTFAETTRSQLGATPKLKVGKEE